MAINRYNCTLPANLFVGYEEVRRELPQDLRSGKSFALLGGRRCGKTSFLLQLEQDLSTQGLDDFHALPRFLDIQGLGQISAAQLFRAIYQLVAQGTNAPAWKVTEPGNEYQDFLALLRTAQPALEQQYGTLWCIVLLVDELDSTVTKLPDDQFFQNLRNLLMVSKFHTHFRLVASGVKEMSRLIASGSSPLNNLCHIYLRILTPSEADRLIAFGFPNGIGMESQTELLHLTGRHPYLLQGLLEKLKKKESIPDRFAVNQAAQEFLREHKDFQRWLEGFEPAEQAAYQALAETPSESLNETELRRALKPSFRPKLDEAITVLSFHGLIDDSDSNRLRIAGKLFQQWWLQNVAPPQNQRAEILSSLLGTTAIEVAEKPSGYRSCPPTPASAATDSAADDITPVIADHVIASDLPFGRGAYGQVWLARNVIGTYRAVKVLRRDSFREAYPFEREFNGIRAYEPISRAHAGLVQILHVGRNDGAGYFYYVMELADDEIHGRQIEPRTYCPKNLGRELSRRGRLPLPECIRLVVALVEALGFLHDNGLIHRDIKPSNIIFVNDSPKLADIGLVTTMGRHGSDISWVGTEGFFPPEGPGTAAADLYGLGKLLYQVCTGYDCRRFPELPTDIVEGPDRHLFAGLNEIMGKACYPTPAGRYQSTGLLLADLSLLNKHLRPG